MSLLGLVRHLAEMERATFRVMMAGQDVPRLIMGRARCAGAEPARRAAGGQGSCAERLTLNG